MSEKTLSLGLTYYEKACLKYLAIANSLKDKTNATQNSN